MSPITTESQDKDEKILDEGYDEASEAEESVSERGESIVKQAAISDRRRRKLRAQGIDPDAAPTSVDPNARSVSAPKGRPTPSQSGEVRSRNPIMSRLAGVREYFSDVRAELNKVTWLSRQDLQRLSIIVLAVTTAAALFLGLVSYVFGSLTGAIAQSSVIAGVIAIGLIVIVAGVWLLRDRLFPTLE